MKANRIHKHQYSSLRNAVDQGSPGVDDCPRWLTSLMKAAPCASYAPIISITTGTHSCAMTFVFCRLSLVSRHGCSAAADPAPAAELCMFCGVRVSKQATSHSRLWPLAQGTMHGPVEIVAVVIVISMMKTISYDDDIDVISTCLHKLRFFIRIIHHPVYDFQLMHIRICRTEGARRVHRVEIRIGKHRVNAMNDLGKILWTAEKKIVKGHADAWAGSSNLLACGKRIRRRYVTS